MAAKEKQARLNNEIRVPEVRVTGADGEQLGILSIAEALQASEEADLDLVEISPDANPPVCRIMDYGKFIFETKKKQSVARKKQKQIHVKEVKFRPGTDEGDYQVKLRNLMRFLDDGDRVKVTIRFRGREMAHQELGTKLLRRIGTDAEESGTVEQFPNRLEGRQLVMLIAPKRKK